MPGYYRFLLVGQECPTHESTATFQPPLRPEPRRVARWGFGGGAADVVEADLVTEVEGLRIAAVFAANADLEVRTSFATVLHGSLHQTANAGLVNCPERVGSYLLRCSGMQEICFG